MVSHDVFSRSREKKGPAALQRGDEGQRSLITGNARLPLSYPTTSWRAPFLSRFVGEDSKGAF